MIVCKMANNDFSQWLLEELEQRGLSYSEVARRGSMSHARISQIVSGGNPGSDFCLGIAKALDLPPETVFRKAGILPPEPDLTSREKINLHLFRQLSLAEQERQLAVMRALLKREQENTEQRRRESVAGQEA